MYNHLTFFAREKEEGREGDEDGKGTKLSLYT
jgi:hypothetical protein